ncbi:glycosyltransferase family 2 protein [Leptolyngbya sp. AN03gr2]|uniref:glycosyltransferase family 2 protein n=1 Tax=unclassified Leptolyngbya TaxID=2650499 RepID=UPI003D31237B
MAEITIVVVPRERFSYTRESLESVYQYTTVPFKLVYVDGNSPPDIQTYLQGQSQEKGFQIIRTDYYLYPNRARNLGLSLVDTPYVVFLDNDVVVSPGWLEALIHCAKETDATIVGPLVCHEEPVHEVVHCAGGEVHINVDIKGRRRLREKMYKQGHRVEKVRPKMHRTQTELCEFHCMLAQTDIFQRVGLLDETLLNSKEHLDFCMTVIQAGGTIYYEPDCILTYVPSTALRLSDLHFYMLRWSDAWEQASLSRLREKWDLAEDGYFQHKYKIMGWRRKNTILRPLARRLALGWKGSLLEKGWVFVLTLAEKPLNRYLTARYAAIERQRTEVSQQVKPPVLETTR